MKPTREQLEASAEREDVVAFADRWLAAQDAKTFDPAVEFVKMTHEDWLAAIIAIAKKTEADRRHDPTLAAGLLEDFLGKYGEAYFDIVLELSRRWPRFRYLLGGVWQGSMKKGLWHKIEAIRGQPW